MRVAIMIITNKEKSSDGSKYAIYAWIPYSEQDSVAEFTKLTCEVSHYFDL